MKKLLTLFLAGLFVVSFALGMMFSTAAADDPNLCKFKCIDGDTYICCWVNGNWACGFYEEGCGPP